MPEPVIRVGHLQLHWLAKQNRLLVTETEPDTPPEVFESISVISPLEAETLARILAQHFGANQFIVLHPSELPDEAADRFFDRLTRLAELRDVETNGPNKEGHMRSLHAITLTMNEILLARYARRP